MANVMFNESVKKLSVNDPLKIKSIENIVTKHNVAIFK